jgi:hypothetical protein
MAPSSPSERKAVEDAEDRSPDLRPFQPPSQTRAKWARVQWFPEFSAISEKTLAEFLPSSNDPIDGPRGRGAHSCGAVAEFHRLPEHPDDICG